MTRMRICPIDEPNKGYLHQGEYYNLYRFMDYPRVLVVAPVKFNQETGSGVTMDNLF
jgi:hypothetical protein